MVLNDLMRAIHLVSSTHREARPIFLFCLAFVVLGVVAFIAAAWSNSLVLTLNSFTLVHGCMLLTSSVAPHIVDASLTAKLCKRKHDSALHHGHHQGHDHSHGHGGKCGHASTSCEHDAPPIDFLGSESQNSEALPSRGFGVRPEYPYGVLRAEILVQYAAHVVMIFAACKTLVECAQKILEPHDTSPVLVEAVSLLHCALVCLTARYTDEETLALLRRRRHAWRHQISFYVVRCQSPLSCLVSCHLVMLTELARLDLLFASVLASKIALDCYRQAGVLGGILLNKPPSLTTLRTSDGAGGLIGGAGYVSVANKARREMQLVPGVLAVNAFRVWTLSPGVDCVSAKVSISKDVEERDVLLSLRQVLEPVATFYTIQLESYCGARLLKACDVDFASHTRGYSPQILFPPPPPPPSLQGLLGIPHFEPSANLTFPGPPDMGDRQT
jgi:Co/Zn/Cd efflux system component